MTWVTTPSVCTFFSVPPLLSPCLSASLPPCQNTQSHYKEHRKRKKNDRCQLHINSMTERLNAVYQYKTECWSGNNSKALFRERNDLETLHLLYGLLISLFDSWAIGLNQGFRQIRKQYVAPETNKLIIKGKMNTTIVHLFRLTSAGCTYMHTHHYVIHGYTCTHCT